MMIVDCKGVKCRNGSCKIAQKRQTSRARVWQEEWEPMPWDYCRRTAYTETKGSTYNWHEERERCKRDAKLSRYRQYQVHFYGSPMEKEIKNSRLRATLKGQLELLEPPQKQFVKRIGETLEVAEKIRQEEGREREKDMKHRQFLAEFKETNKTMIEVHAHKRKEQKQEELKAEQHRLTLNPINWSHTLW